MFAGSALVRARSPVTGLTEAGLIGSHIARFVLGQHSTSKLLLTLTISNLRSPVTTGLTRRSFHSPDFTFQLKVSDFGTKVSF